MKEYQTVSQKPIIMWRTLTEIDQNIFTDKISCFIDQLKKYPVHILYLED